jgi:hypothetical protein
MARLLPDAPLPGLFASDDGSGGDVDADGEDWDEDEYEKQQDIVANPSPNKGSLSLRFYNEQFIMSYSKIASRCWNSVKPQAPFLSIKGGS